MGSGRFAILVAVVVAAVGLGAHQLQSGYLFFAGYAVLLAIVLAVAWNIVGGYTGYMNFGVSALMALGTYSGVAITKLVALPMPLLMLLGGIVPGLVGLGIGYLTMRLKGIYFAIATFAIAIIAQTVVTNWELVGGSRGIFTLAPRNLAIVGSYAEYIFLLMLALAGMTVIIARSIERSRIGLGFAAIRDDEVAAEAMGVPTLRLKLFATGLSGFLMGVAGVPFPYFVSFLEPTTVFSISYSVNALAMAMIGGTSSWLGPFVGALLLGIVQQVSIVTISSEINLLIVGLILILFVSFAPHGLIGLGRRLRVGAR